MKPWAFMGLYSGSIGMLYQMIVDPRTGLEITKRVEKFAPFFFGSSGGASGGGGTSTIGTSSSGFGSGIGHMCMVIVQSGSMTVSQTAGSIISLLGPIKS